MKKIKRCSLFLLLLVLIFSFTACSARTAITADTFQKEAKNCGYTVKQTTSTNTNITSAYTGTTSNADDELDFVIAESDAAAQDVYNSMKDSIKVKDSKPQTIDSSTYSKYVVTNGELYYVLARIDKTVVYAKAMTSNKATVDKFFNAIKY